MRNPKGIVLAGGTGSRLFPLTKVTNKHLLPVGTKPMIFHPIERLLEAKIKDILVITGPDHVGDIIQVLGSGKNLNCRFLYTVQEEAGGIAQALGLAKDFVGDSKCVAILGDNIFMTPITNYVSRFTEQPSGARILLKEVNNPSRFGVAEVSGNRIISIEEKPEKPKSSFIITGVYMYDHQVFDIIPDLKLSGRQELEISDINATYLKWGTLQFDILSGGWVDAGTFESLAQANHMVTSDQ